MTIGFALGLAVGIAAGEVAGRKMHGYSIVMESIEFVARRIRERE